MWHLLWLMTLFQLQANASFCLLPCSLSRVLYFEVRPLAALRRAGCGGFNALGWCVVSRFAALTDNASKGDLSQNAASGRATAFASTSESALAKSG